MSTSVCASCLSFSIDKIVKSQPTMKPTWLDKIDYVEEFIEKVTDFKIRKQKNYDTFLDLEIKNCANKKILYWAAESKPFYDVFTKAKQLLQWHGILRTAQTPKPKSVSKQKL